jgi:hypothetical protein
MRTGIDCVIVVEVLRSCDGGWQDDFTVRRRDPPGTAPAGQ